MKTRSVIMWFITTTMALITCMLSIHQNESVIYVVGYAILFMCCLSNFILCLIRKFLDND